MYGSLDEASRLARSHSIVLTPHTTISLPSDGRRIDDFQILASGIFNLGFIAVGPGSEAFLEWWWSKTRRGARSDPSRMMFTDQRWVDFVPAFFDHVVLRDCSYNVAYWNLHSRRLAWGPDGYTVDDRPLGFFHFSGFDVSKPHLLSKHQGHQPRILLSENAALDRICREYQSPVCCRRVTNASPDCPTGGAHSRTAPPSPVECVASIVRRLNSMKEGQAVEPPCPFGSTTAKTFIEWLNEPIRPALGDISRYNYSIYEDRGDLKAAFPDLAGQDGPRYVEWLRLSGSAEEAIPVALQPPAIGRGTGRPGAGLQDTSIARDQHRRILRSGSGNW